MYWFGQILIKGGGSMEQFQTSFINSLIDGAQRSQSEFGVFASVTIAQAIEESGWGRSYLAKNDKNLFGIKMPGAKPSGISIVQGSWATDDGGYYRKYNSWGDSIYDHGYFLKVNSRYAAALQATDYKSQAKAIQNAGYAGNPDGYASRIIGYITSYNLNQYDGGNSNPRSTAPDVNTDNNADNNEIKNANSLAIPATNFSVVAGSAVAGNVLYGRRYRVIVSTGQGNALDISKLRCTFNVQKTIVMEPNFSEITIYNLNPQTENAIINEGMRIVIEAGYEGAQYGLIFDGDVIQPIRDKEDGVTYKLTLRSLDGDRFINGGIVNFSLLKGQSSRQIVDECTSKATNPTQLGNISSGLVTTELTRGKVCFGLARDYLRQVAQNSNATFYVEDGKVNIIKAEDIPVGEATELSPSSGLIGIPTQSEYGVNGKCLLNPRIKINSLIHIDNSLIRARQAEIGQVFRSLDGDGIYRVIKINHVGDTRGDEWYTEFETVSQAGLVPGILKNSEGSPW